MTEIDRITDLDDGFPTSEKAGFYDQIVKHLFDKTKIRMVGRLQPDMVQIVRRLSIAQSTFDLPEWEVAIQNFIEIGISEKGKSREEILEMVAGVKKAQNSLEKAKEMTNRKPEARDI
jgi:hypothetical protein